MSDATTTQPLCALEQVADVCTLQGHAAELFRARRWRECVVLSALIIESGPTADMHFLMAKALQCLGSVESACGHAVAALSLTDSAEEPRLVADILYAFGPEMLAGIA